MRNVHKIIYLTGSRSEYGLMKNTLKKLATKFDLGIIVTGTHLHKKYGYSIKEIKKDRLKIVKKIPLKDTSEDLKTMVRNFGILTKEITEILEKVGPDLVLVEGDRLEQLAMTISAATMNIPVAHTSGGAISKSIDDSTRNAITKFAHIHLAPTKKSAQRIIKMGEEPWRVNVVGPPINLKYKVIDTWKKFSLEKNKPLILVLQHPISTQVNDSKKQMRQTLEALKELKNQTVIIYPNGDPGSENMIKEIEKFRKIAYFKIFKNLENDIFMNLLKNADVIVGNSSAGIVESPFFKLPTINIGIRQKGRECGDNIINVNHDKDEIIRGIEKTRSKKFKIRKNPYKVKGLAEDNIISVISNLKLNSKVLQKEPTF